MKKIKLIPKGNKGLKVSQNNDSDMDYDDYMEELSKRLEKTIQSLDLRLMSMLNDNTFNYELYFKDNREFAIKDLDLYRDPKYVYDNRRYYTAYHPLFNSDSIYSNKQSQYNPKGTIGGSFRESSGGLFNLFGIPTNNSLIYTPSYDQVIKGDFDYLKALKYIKDNYPSKNIYIDWDDSEKPSLYIKLDTYYPMVSDYFPGHSSLSISGLDERRDGTAYYNNREINKTPSDTGYNLITNNCSDATRRALEYTFNIADRPLFFTTPGDVQDFSLDYLNGIPEIKDGLMFNPNTGKYEEYPERLISKKRLAGQSTIYIPITKEQNQKLFKYIKFGNQKGNF